MKTKTNKTCYCEACKIEGRKHPNEATDLADGVAVCKEHKRIFERNFKDVIKSEEEDEWN